MIYTFYSFKGGVGRSMALANLAEFFYRKGLHVLVVDFDLEAPGLERFFAPQLPDEVDATTLTDPARTAFLEKVWKQRGVIDMAMSFKALRSLPIGGTAQPDSLNPVIFDHPIEPLVNFLYPIYNPGSSGDGALYLIPAGRRTTEEYGQYTERVRTFDWDDFYINRDGGRFFDWLRKEMLSLADVVLVDSRTGITEMTGICTYHLADIVVMLAAPNEQNLEGISIIADSLKRRQQASPERNLKTLIIPSRVELTESLMLERFKRQFISKLGGYNTPDLDPAKIFDELGIPYVARYAYFEKLAMREPDHPVAAKINPFYERLAQTMWCLAPKDSSFYRRYYQGTRPALPEPEGLPEPDPDFTGRQWVFSSLEAWLVEGKERYYLIKGEPGSGKTALAVRLWQMSRGDIETGGFTHLGTGALQFAHFCSPARSETLNPRTLITNLASALAGQFPDYAFALAKGSDDRLNIDVRQTIGVTEQGAQVTGVQIGSLQTGTLPLEASFDRLLRQPLLTLCSQQPTVNIRILIDGLDAALDSDAPENLLSLLQWSHSLPQQVRFVLTSRNDPRVLTALNEADLFVQDLDGASSENQADVAAYIQKKLSSLIGNAPADLIENLATAAEGNFLYAQSMAEAILANPAQAEDLFTQPLPQNLSQVYNQYLKTRLAGKVDSWNQRDGKLLGLLVVAKGEGLNQVQLAGILGWKQPEVDDCLRSWAQILEVNPASGVMQFFHPALRDYLLTNPDYPIFPYEANRDIASYFYKEWAGRWSKNSDPYALRYTPWHLADALLLTPSRKERQELINRLALLLSDARFRQVKTSLFGIEAIKEDFTTALEIIPASHPAYQELSDQFHHLAGAQLESVPRILLNTEIEDHNPEEPLRLGEIYTLAFSLEDQRGDAQPAVEFPERPSELQDETAQITIDLFSQDFDFATSRQVLRLPRSGRARGRVRFDIEPLHDGECILQALITRQGGFLQSQTVRLFTEKMKRGQRPSATISGRELTQSFLVPKRDLVIIILPEGNGYRMTLAGTIAASAWIPISLRGLQSIARNVIYRALYYSQGRPDTKSIFQEGVDIPEMMGRKLLYSMSEWGSHLYNDIFFSNQADIQTRLLGTKLKEITRKESLKISVISDQFPLPWHLLYPAKGEQNEKVNPEIFLGARHIIEQIPLQSSMPLIDSRIALQDAHLGLTISTAMRRKSPEPAKRLSAMASELHAQSRVNVWQRTSSQEVVEALTNPDNHDELVYFHCKGAPEPLSDPKGRTATLLLAENQKVAFEDLATSYTTPFTGHPLFIFNIPEATHFSSPSLIAALLGRGGRACIAPQMKLPAVFCADWGVRFFERFFNGMPAGQALLEIRREYLLKHNNPLGLFYGLYGDADTRFVLPQSASELAA